MAKMTEQQREEFLADTHVGILSVAGGPGRPPTSVPTFYAYEPGGEITMFTGTQRRAPKRIELIKAAGVVTLVVQREQMPPAYVTVEAELVEVGKPTTEQMLTIARRYMPEEHAQGYVQTELGDPENIVTLFTFRPTRWLTSDTSR
ncbi:pyridoxamine 5-phosphate oxidase [Kribbella qitaiheensis]|uniref:Pyridoxamine 5-phosphate oxidase n=1 Tax=Kribbella qitaiheensis TaxID=1544730 RepID=A0A7G6X208_9ACTN|nr:pyridoxamine 5-phosphate oxidase [Kribbella qitaiheensis]QNE20273.1 pyridoxamine 5-phosphate oxidase [Kribbella qitaiheensis]